MKKVKFTAVIITFVFLLSAQALGRVRVVAQVDQAQDIYVGQSFKYLIIIDGDNKPGQVDLSPLARYNPQNAGNRDVSQVTTSIINNKVSRNVIKRYVMTYSLTANTPGTVQLPPVTVTLDGRQYQTNPVQVSILKPGTTDKLDFDVVLSEQKCYVGQPVIMTVKFYVLSSADVGEFQFNIPVLTSDSFYIEEPETSDPQAKQYRLHSGITAHVSQHSVQYRGESYILVSFNKVLIPKHPGRINLGTSSVSAALAVGRVRSPDPFFDNFSFFGSQKKYRRFAVSSKPLTLTVLPLPEQGRPEGFYGLVGRYTIEASAAPTKISVGDPITLTIKIAGSRYLKPVKWPQLQDISELARNFKIPAQRASPTLENGARIFTQTIRANNDQVTRIPPIPLAYFDVDAGEYVVAETDPIELEVAPTKILTNADLEGIEQTYVSRQVEVIKKGISANYEGPDVLTNQTFSPLAALVSPGYLVIWSVPLLALAASSLAKVLTHTSPEKLAHRRRRQAAAKAVKQLKKMSNLSEKEQNELIVSTMKQYIGDRFDKVAGSLTADDCYEIIADITQDRQTAGRYRDIVAGSEASRYTCVQDSVESVKPDEIVHLIRTIEKNSRE
jgi:hypothetical protein